MTGERVEVTLPSGRNAFGTLLGPEFSDGPSSILIDGMKPARLVDRDDWDFLPALDGGDDRG